MGDCIRRSVSLALRDGVPAVATYSELENILSSVHREHGDATYIIVSDTTWLGVRNRYQTQQRLRPVNVLGVFGTSHQGLTGLLLDRSVLLSLDRENENPDEAFVEFWYGCLPDSYKGKLTLQPIAYQ